VRTAIALSLVAILAACGKVEENSYPSFVEAKTAGAVESGWVPGWLPPSSVQIRAAHKLRSRQSVLAARFSPADAWIVPSFCKPIGQGEIGAAPFRPSWWTGVPSSGSATGSYAYFSCEEGKSFLVVSTSQGELYFWRLSGV
jgi:hypothetical protein